MCSEPLKWIQASLCRIKILKFKWLTQVAWMANNLYNRIVNNLKAESSYSSPVSEVTNTEGWLQFTKIY